MKTWLEAIEEVVVSPMKMDDTTVREIAMVKGSDAKTAKSCIVNRANKSDKVAHLKVGDNKTGYEDWLIPKKMLTFLNDRRAVFETGPSVGGDVGGLFHGIPVITEVEDEGLKFIPKPIPTGYVEQNGELKAIATAVRENMALLMVGPTGCGKTACVLDTAGRIGQPTIRVSVSREIDEFALFGKWIKAEVDGQIIMVWVDGPVTMAMRNGYWLVLDEVNTGDPAVMVQTHSIFDNGTIVLTIKDNELVVAHPNFRIFGAINPVAEGYAGTIEMNKATLSRFSIVKDMEYLSANLEEQVIQDQSDNYEPELAGKLVKFAGIIRRASTMEAEQMVNLPVSTRDLISAMKLAKHYGVREASELAIIGKSTDPEEKTWIRDQFENVFGF